MNELIARLARGERIDGRVALVVAHPDDETVGLGSRLALFDDLTLIHLTDGAPDDPGFAARAGFADAAAYAAARRAELDAALVTLGALPARHLALALPDQRAHEHLDHLVTDLATALAGHAAVITHAYEHGHPDHDTAALAVALACARIGEGAPERIEFASYHRVGNEIAFGRFYPDASSPETSLPLSPAQVAVKRAAFAAYATQASTLAAFDPARETVRPAPIYDFNNPAPPQDAVYELWRFTISSDQWLAETKRARVANLEQVGR